MPQSSAPIPPASKTGSKGKEALTVGFGCLCLVLIGWYVVAGVRHFFCPPRPERLLEPVRAVQNGDEKAVRREIEKLARSAMWEGGTGKELPPPDRVGKEPRAGVSALNFCNYSGKDVVLYFDGAEIFKLDVKSGASVAIEVKSGTYEYLIVAAPRQGDVPTSPFYRRCDWRGTYHELLRTAGDEAAVTCSGRHEQARAVK